MRTQHVEATPGADRLLLVVPLVDDGAIAVPHLVEAMVELVDFCSLDVGRDDMLAALEAAMERYDHLTAAEEGCTVST